MLLIELVFQLLCTGLLLYKLYVKMFCSATESAATESAATESAATESRELGSGPYVLHIVLIGVFSYSAYAMFTSNNVGQNLMDVIHWSYKLNILCIVLSFVFDYSAILYTMILLIVEACIIYPLLKRAFVGEDVGLLLIMSDMFTSIRSVFLSVAECVIHL